MVNSQNGDNAKRKEFTQKTQSQDTTTLIIAVEANPNQV